MNTELNYNSFLDPPVEFRPVPFWGLNDDLKDETLRSQIAEMREKGWGRLLHASALWADDTVSVG